MKTVLIISPYFPPSNAADMQRVRMSLPYLKEFGWQAEVVCVDQKYSETIKDDLLLKSVPKDVVLHTIKAFSKNWTGKLGLGSIALRSLWFYRVKVNKLLRQKQFDLVYFSTTQFPVCILGAYWKRKFKVPYIVDMQDPWHSDYYKNKPKQQRPKKYWFSYRLNKSLEPKAMKAVDGLISVSENYITLLKKRYPQISRIPSETITFGAFDADMDIAEKHQDLFPQLLDPSFINVVYIGRGGADMHKAITPLFNSLKDGLTKEAEIFGRLRFYFIGTSYAPVSQGKPTILPLARRLGVEKQVVEISDRVSFYHALATLNQANALFIPGSDDPKYTASKLYQYMLTKKPVLALFDAESPAIPVLKEYGVESVFAYAGHDKKDIYEFLGKIARNELTIASYNQMAIEKYSAREMTSRQCALFDKVLGSQVKKEGRR